MPVPPSNTGLTPVRLNVENKYPNGTQWTDVMDFTAYRPYIENKNSWIVRIIFEISKRIKLLW